MLQKFHNPRKLAEPQIHERVMSPCPFRNRLYVGLIAFNSSSPILMLASSSTASNLVMNSTGAEKSAGLRLPESKTEIVLQTERPAVEVDMLVDSADAAAIDFERFG